MHTNVDAKCACKRPATYGKNIPGCPATHCAIHKSDEMVNKIYGICSEKHCNSRATYGYSLIGVGRSKCAAHKSDDMVNIEQYGICTKHGCTQQAVYGILNPLRCAAHKDAEMRDLVRNWCCHPGCTLSRRTNTTLFCVAHQS